MAYLDPVNGATLLESLNLVAGSPHASASAAYAQWAAEIGVSDTETLSQINEDDSAWELDLGFPVLAGGEKTSILFSSEGGVSLMARNRAGNVSSSTSVTSGAATRSRMQRWRNAALLVTVGQPTLDARSELGKWQKSGQTAILFARHRTHNAQTAIIDVAWRFSPGLVEIVATNVSQTDPRIQVFVSNEDTSTVTQGIVAHTWSSGTAHVLAARTRILSVAPPILGMAATRFEESFSVLGKGSAVVSMPPLALASGRSVLGGGGAHVYVGPLLRAAASNGVLGAGRSFIAVGIEATARGASILSPWSAARITPVLPSAESIAAISYTLTLTGSPDIIIPISSWQMRRRLGGNAWLSCVAPGADAALISAISARADGRLILRHHTHMLGGAVYTDTVLDVPLTDFSYDRGSRSSSATLTANVPDPNSDPMPRPVWGETYRAMSGGLRRARFARVDPELQPGDTVVFGDGESWTVGAMVTWVGARESNMEISEAETD